MDTPVRIFFFNFLIEVRRPIQHMNATFLGLDTDLKSEAGVERTVQVGMHADILSPHN